MAGLLTLLLGIKDSDFREGFGRCQVKRCLRNRRNDEKCLLGNNVGLGKRLNQVFHMLIVRPYLFY